MTRAIAALVCALTLAMTACKFQPPQSPNGSCEQTPGQCGYRS